MIRFIVFSALFITLFSCDSFTQKDPSVEYLTGKIWVLTNIGNIRSDTTVQTTLSFNEDNQISGSAGCNQYFGSYELKEGSFTVTGIGATKKMCAENVMTQEDNFLTTLDAANSMKLFGSNLVIYSDEVIDKLKFKQQ